MTPGEETGRWPFVPGLFRRHRFAHRDQLGDGDELESFRLQLIERVWHRFDRARMDSCERMIEPGRVSLTIRLVTTPGRAVSNRADPRPKE